MKVKLLILLAFISISSLSNATNYYWIGGSGNWSDINHWATSSGGSTLHSVIPSPNDDVFFDAGSGFTVGSNIVTINLSNASCKNMNWTGALNNPILKGTSGGIYTYGSLTLSPAMTCSVGSIYFKASTSESITTNGVKISGSSGASSVYFSGSGSWTFMDDFIQETVNFFTSYTIFEQGTINTNGKTFTTGSFKDDYSAGAKTLNLGSSLINIYYGGTYSPNFFSSWQSSGITVINPGTSKIIFHGLYGVMATKSSDNFYDVQFNDLAYMTGGGKYNSLTFLKDSKILSDLNTQKLNLSPNTTCEISNVTLTISATFNATITPCGGYSTLKCLLPGSQFTITAPGTASINVNNMVIQDSKVQGGASFNVSNSYDTGNNLGWTFTPPPITNLYWVGGSGNWNDINHWSNSSGGPGGSCLPSPNSNVFFDAGSGFSGLSKTVTLIGPSFCKNITCSGMSTPATYTIINNATDALYIYGSSLFQTGMLFSVASTFYQSNSPETITTNNVTFSDANVTFFGNGSWAFQDPVTQTSISTWPNYKSVTLNKGLLNTNNQLCNFFSFSGNSSSFASHTLSLGSSVVNVTGSGFLQSQWNFNGTSSILVAGTSTINLTGISSATSGFYTKQGHTYNTVNLFNSTGFSSGCCAGSPVYFNNVTFYKSSYLGGVYTFTNLTLGIASSCVLTSYVPTFTVLSQLTSLTPSCGGWASIESSTPGSQIGIYVPATGTVSVRNCLIKDIIGLGGAIFSATTSIDGGNNTGWTFGAVATNTLFWVGGTGDWNDINHWSFTSGGAGGACVPGPGDDVFIDVNSGLLTSSRTITIQATAIAYCHNMTCSGAATPAYFNGLSTASNNGGILKIYGSLILQNGMQFNNLNGVYFMSKNNETILSNNVTIHGGNGGVQFTGSGGVYTLLDNLTAAYNMGIAATTTLNANSKNISSFGDIANQGHLNMDNSYVSCSRFFTYTLSTISANSNTLQCSGGSTFTFYDYSSGQKFNYVYMSNGGKIETIGLPTYKKVYFGYDGIIKGRNKMDTLILTADRVYQFDATNTQTITSAFYPSGNPCFVTFIKSTLAGTQASLNIQSGNINYDYVNITDINATPSYTPLQFAGHTTNTGNNTNMVFAPTATAGIIGLGPDQTVCGSSLPLTLNTFSFYPNPVTTFTWTGGVNTPSLSISSGGIYSVTVKYSSACTVTDNIAIAITAPTVTASSSILCSGNSSTLTVAGANTYTWSTSSNATSIVVNPTVTTTYSVVGTTTTGCVANAVTVVTVTSGPTISIASVSNSMICSGNASSITPSGASSYTLVNTGASGTSFTVNPTASTTYSIIGATAGCKSNNVAQTTITVNTTPTVAISSVSNPTICSGNSSIITPSGATSYTLVNTGATGTSFNVSPTTNTTYTIIGASAACASANNAQQLITVNTTPTVSILSVSNSTICSGNSATITPNGATSYTLLNTGATGTSFNVSPATNTTYTIIGSSAACTSANNAQQLITVNATPTITAIGPASGTICSGEVFTITPSGASAGSYTLTPGNIVSASSFTVAPNTTTTYTINGSNTNGCSSTASTDLNVPVSVNASPTVTAVFSSNALCATQSVTIALSGANANYTLNPGNTIISAGTASVVITPTAGTTNYTITGNNANGCVSVLASQIYTTSVSVVTNPTITASAITNSICAGGTASITPFGATTFTLMPGNITIASGQTFTLTPSANTSYTINGTATGGCMSIPSTQFVTTIGVNQNPTLTAVSALGNVLCSGLSTTLTASGATSYTWASGPNTPDYVVSPSATTIYTVTGTDVNGCSNSAAPMTLTISVLSSPSLALATTISSNTLCSGNSATIALAGADPGATYTLIPSNTTSTLSFVVSPTATQGYTVIATNFNGCTTSLPSQQYTTSVSVAASPTISLVSALPSNSICSGQSATISVSGAAAGSYTLINNPLATEPFIVSPTSSTAYTITGTGANGCVSLPGNELTTLITVSSSPTISLVSVTPSQTLCAGQSATISVSGAAAGSYTLINNPSATEPFVVSPSASTIYTITGSSANGCVSLAGNELTVNITIGGGIILSTNVTSVSCNGGNNGQIIASASSAGSITYSWSSGSNAPVASGLSAGVYTLTLSDNFNCSLTQTVDVIQPNALVFSELSNNASCDNDPTGDITISITGGTPSYSVNWSNGNNGLSAFVLPTGPISATVTDANNCNASFSSVIISKTCLTTLIPQLISPNGDGKNEFFVINTIEQFPNNKLQIFNRWGNLVYSKDKYDNSFEGKANISNANGNGLLPASTYYVIFDFGDDKTPPYKGYLEVKY